MTAVELAYLEGYRSAISDLRSELNSMHEYMERELGRLRSELRSGLHDRARLQLAFLPRPTAPLQ
jgi:hypothetical protein